MSIINLYENPRKASQFRIPGSLGRNLAIPEGKSFSEWQEIYTCGQGRGVKGLSVSTSSMRLAGRAMARAANRPHTPKWYQFIQALKSRGINVVDICAHTDTYAKTRSSRNSEAYWHKKRLSGNRWRYKKPRENVNGIVLHQTMHLYTNNDDPMAFKRTGCHFVVTPNGTIVQRAPIDRYIQAASIGKKNKDGTDKDLTVSIEFVGKFQSIHSGGVTKLTKQQAIAGQHLVRGLIKEMNFDEIYAHRQFSTNKKNDPGPDIWFYVGEWAMYHFKSVKNFRRLGLGIHPKWEKWGYNKRAAFRKFGTSFDL